MDYFDEIKDEYLDKFSVIFSVYKIDSIHGTKEGYQFNSKVLEECVQWIADKGEQYRHYTIQQEYYKL